MVLQEKLELSKEPVCDGFASNGRQNGAVPDSATVEPQPVDRDALRRDIQRHLESIGLYGGESPGVLSKEAIRHIHRFHRKAAHDRIHSALGNKIDRFLKEIANGEEVDPEKIRPRLVEVRPGTRNGDLFRFATLLWSIPVSQG